MEVMGDFFAKFIIWAGMSFWGWPHVLLLFSEPEDGWYRLFVFILWGATLVLGPFMLTMINLEAVIKGYLK